VCGSSKLLSGFEIDFGFLEPSWASIAPIDPCAAGVVRDGGLMPLYDPDGLLDLLAEATTLPCLHYDVLAGFV
jgi:hypothetical protein